MFKKGHPEYRKNFQSSFYKECLNCKKLFKIRPSLIKRNRGKYCSHQCCIEYWKKTGLLKGRIVWNKGNKSGKYIKCKSCRKDFYIIPSQFNYRNPRYCSHKCQPSWNKGLTKEIDKRVLKYSNSQKGRKSTKYWLGKERLHMSGEKHWFWKGGVTPLEKLIRQSLEYKNWRNSIYKRDFYICQECFKKDRKIIAHHIKSFIKIFQEFLQRYSQFSPIEDKETLVRLAITYQPFWDINNGKTLCDNCHRRLEVSLKQEV